MKGPSSGSPIGVRAGPSALRGTQPPSHWGMWCFLAGPQTLRVSLETPALSHLASGKLRWPLFVSAPAFVRSNELIYADCLGKCLAECELLFIGTGVHEGVRVSSI